MPTGPRDVPTVVDLDTRRARGKTIFHGIINEYAHAA
jgi:hypothetical protein